MAGTQNGVELLKEAQNLGFVDFTKSLVSGVFDVVVQSQIDQMKAYAELLAQVSQSLAAYQQEVTGIDFSSTGGAGAASSQLQNYIKQVLNFDLGSATGGNYALDQDEYKLLENHFGATALKEDPAKITAPSVSSTGPVNGQIDVDYLKKKVYDKLDADTAEQYNLLVEMMKLGFARIDVTNGHVETKMNMHVTALDQETASSYTADSRANDWHAGGHVKGVFKKIGFGVSGRYTGSRFRVSASNTQSISRTALDATMSGEVRIAFATSSFGPVTPVTPVAPAASQ